MVKDLWCHRYSSMADSICHALLGYYLKLIQWKSIIFSKIITIHHECPCRIGKSHSKGQNFYQGRGLLSPWLKFLPWGWDFPILHGLAHDGLFFSHFYWTLNLKSDSATTVEKLNFLTSGLKWILSSSACLSGLAMGVNIVCTWKIEGKHDLLTTFSSRG